MTAAVLRADARHLPLPDECVDLVVTSPPYFGLRSYTDGGQHYDGQIGSEATPAQWLEALWACTAEWVRVLKPEGSIFVNLGDSYASQPVGKPGANGHVNGKNPAEAHAARRGERNKRPTGGRQFTREDAAWLAGVIDSDGSISIRLNRQAEGRSPSFVPWVRIGQKRPEVVKRAGAITGIGQVFEDARGVWNWNVAAQQARWILARIYPWLVIKRRQAAAAIELARHVEERNGRGSYRPLTHNDIVYRQSLKDACIAWNRGECYDLTVPEPQTVPLPIYPLAPRAKSLYDLPHAYAEGCVGYLGLIKRAEIVWAKPNGLPESVTDRVRRAHEQVFHFTRQPRYYAAVDEIREPQVRGDMQGKIQRGHDRRVGHGNNGFGFTEDFTREYNPLGKLPGSVWDIPSQPLTVPPSLGVDHFAAFPMELPRRIIAGWSPPGVCTACGQGRRPVSVAHGESYYQTMGKTGRDQVPGDRKPPSEAGNTRLANGTVPSYPLRTREITGYACACPRPDAPTRPARVLDPFGGTGTTALLASVLGRHGITADLSADYCRLAAWRTTDPGERARAMQVPKPPPVPDGMDPLFTL